MNIELSSDLQTLAENLVASGRYSSVDEVLGEGIRVLAAQERLRQQVETGSEQADRGDVVDHDTVFAHLRSLVTAAQDARSAQ
jgi:antitoxin ParD1/3/4